MSRPAEDTELRTRLATAYDVATKVLVPIVGGIAIWTLVEVLDHRDRLVRVEVTGVTQEAAARESKQLREAISALREQMAVQAAASRGLSEQMAELRSDVRSVLDEIRRTKER